MRNWIKNEDWLSVFLGVLLIIIAKYFTNIPKLSMWSLDDISALITYNYVGLFAIIIVFSILFVGSMKTIDLKWKNIVMAFFFLNILAFLSFILSAYEYSKIYGFGYAFWGLFIGIVISNIWEVPKILLPVLRPELYVKTGLVLLGAEILFSKMANLGLPALTVAWSVTPLVIVFMYFFGTRVLKMSKELSIVIATATSVCGVSAAIACSAACRAKKEELTLAVSMTLIFTVIMMISMPAIVQLLHLDPLVGGAWIGGTIDSTGAVVAAGAVLGQDAMNVAAIVKMIQNIMVGVVAFVVAILWSLDTPKSDKMNKTISYIEIWKRFPKFILGFIGSSLIFSFLLQPTLGTDFVESITDVSKTYRGWLFTLAFLSIGLESNFSLLAKYLKGGTPIWLYITGQSLNLILTYVVALLAFGGYLFVI